MPEGDTIHRTAANLRKAMLEETIVAATAQPHLMPGMELDGTTVTAIEARGKHLLIHFSNQLVLHSHMGMTGSWHIYRLHDRWQKPAAQAAVTLSTAALTIVCFTPKMIHLRTKTQLRRDPQLQKLGPDILGPPIEDAVLLRRFRTQATVTIGEAVLNQTVICGIGNVYKSEILFLERIHPQTTVSQLTDAQLLLLRDRTCRLMRRNLNTTRRQTRFRGDATSLWVYGRSGHDCLVCGNTIQRIRQGSTARSTYFCPHCQPHPSPMSSESCPHENCPASNDQFDN